MTLALSIYFGIGLVFALGFSILAYFDSDDSRFHWSMFVQALIILFVWPVELYSLCEIIVKDRIDSYKYDKEHKRKNND